MPVSVSVFRAGVHLCVHALGHVHVMSVDMNKKNMCLCTRICVDKGMDKNMWKHEESHDVEN